MNLLSRFKVNTPHALLLAGSSLLTKNAALAFLQELSLFPTDIHHLVPEGKTRMHTQLSIKKLIQEAPLPPYQGEKKCFLIFDAERMLPSHSNALLKVVEEPPPKTLFLLLTSQKENILKTLLSRCQIIHFPEEEKEQHSLFLKILAKEESLDTLIDQLEERKKNLKKELSGDSDEKEIDGALAFLSQEEFYSILSTFQHFYNKKFKISLEENVPCFPTLYQVRKAEKDAKIAFERNIALKTILETFLLRLSF